jgi:hypothetical protein
VGGGLSAAPAALERRIQSEQGRRRRALFELLHGLERTASTGVLRLQVDGHEVGSIVTHQGRVCFAVAGPDEPLPTFADGGDGVARARLGQLAHEARAAGLSFCATLLREPDDAVSRLRAQLLLEAAVAVRMMAECCVHLAVTRTLEHARADYDPRLAFAAAEIYCASLQLDEPPDRDAVMDLFDGFQYSGDAGVLLVREPGRESNPYPVASYGLSSASLQDLLSLCRCAGELMRPSVFMGQPVEPTYTVMRGEEGRHWVCVGSGRHLALIERRDGADLAPVIAQSLRVH